MKIAMVAPIVERIPPKKYGGTERVIYNLTEELTRRGHEVTLFASGDSKTSAKLISVIPRSLREMGAKDLYGTNTWAMLNIGLAYEMQDYFDIIHDHHYEISAAVANLSETPVVLTMHGVINEDNKTLFEFLDNIYYVSISKSQVRYVPKLNLAGNVYNGLAMDSYPFSDQDEGYLLFVGRITEQKGVHLAMDAAWKLGLPLIIAAKLDEVAHDLGYFKKFIKPRLKKYQRLVRWIGEVDEAERNKLMSKALCVLHPVRWPEPFGLTLIESMACGAPVIAFNKGSIPEVIVSGKTGFVVENLSQMIKAIKRISSIKRSECREHALTNFSASRMADGYEQIYEKLLQSHQQRQGYTDSEMDLLAPVFSQRQPPQQVYPHNIAYLKSKLKKEG